MEEIIWKDINEFEGLYQISNYGQIKKVDGDKILIINNIKNEAKLEKDEKLYYRYIHRLVAEYFIDDLTNVNKIIHIDNNFKNNYYKNLKLIYNKKYELQKEKENNNKLKELEIKDKDDEEWKDIKNFEGLYQISNYGKIKEIKDNKTRIFSHKKDRKIIWVVKLKKNNVSISKSIHRLVAKHFIPIKHFGYYVRHIDGDINNNYYKNLEWVPFKNEAIIIDDNIEEIWKPIEGYEGYFISNLGNVKSLKKNNEKILNPKISPRGYYQISVRKNKKRCYLINHRLVAIHFVKNPDPENKKLVDHKDRNKFNNKANNLRWVTDLENSRNLSIFKTNTSGYTGVHHVKNPERWRVYITINKKSKYVGIFKTFEEAKEARINAEKKHYIIKE